jgi:hypothetical protein
MSPRHVAAKKKPPRNRVPAVKAGEAIGELLARGRGRDMADDCMGLSGSGSRVGTALNGFILSWIDRVDPSKLSFEQGLQAIEASVTIMNAVAVTHEAALKPNLSGTGDEPRPVSGRIDNEPLVPAMKSALEMFGKHGED